MAAAGLLARRNLLRAVRSPKIIGGALAVPLLIYLLFLVAFARTVLPGGGFDAYAGFALPGAMAFAVALAIPHAASAVQRDVRDGLADRLRALPIARSALLAGRVGADALITGGQVLLLTAVGVALGARFQGGALDAAAYVLAPVAIGVTLSWLVFPLALRAKSPEEVAGMLSVVLLPLGYLSGGLVPVEALPGWMGAVAVANPLASMVEVMRSAQQGALEAAALAGVAGWTVGGLLVAVPLSARAQRRLGA